MKRLLVFISFTISFLGCSEEKKEFNYTDNPILGIWITSLPEDDIYWVYKFTQNYKFYRYFTVEGKNSPQKFQNDYEISGGQILFKTADYPTDKWTFEFKEKDGNKTLILYLNDGLEIQLQEYASKFL